MSITIGDRVQRRLTALGLNVAEAERLAGVNRTYISDIVSGRKKNVRQLSAVAKALRTTEAWLLTGLGVEDTIYGCEASPSALGSPIVGIDPPGFSVVASEKRRIVITSIDLATGESAYIESVGGETFRAKIVDPALSVRDNAYMVSLSRSRPIVATIKEKLKDLDVVERFIVDAA